MSSPNQRPGSTPDPSSLLQLQFSFAPSFVLSAGAKLGVFSHIAAGNQTAAEIARAAAASERGMRMLLDALVVFELLRKKDGRYELTPTSAEFLVRESPNYVGGILEDHHIVDGWMHLAEVVRTGRPASRVEGQQEAEQFFPVLVRSLHVTNREPARRAAQALGAGKAHSGLRVLDVACGSGVWGIAIAEADPQARLTAQDFPGVLKETRRYVERHGVAERYEFLAGDLKTVDFGDSRFDLALLGNIVHSEGERSARNLFQRLARSLKPGGRIAIADMIPNDERTGPPFPILFALNMLVHTSEGDTYTLAEYTRWLREAGFRQIQTADIGLHSPLVIAS